VSGAGQVAPRVPRTRQVTLLDVLDRLLGGGVLVSGQIMLAAAEIDLVELDLGLLVASVDELRETPPADRRASRAEALPAPRSRRHPPPQPRLPERVNSDSEGLEKGLAQLVLTVIELLRQLMERQALRRIDANTLTDEEVERLGRTFLALGERMDELKEAFGLTDEDLNLNLGPLGDLM
jgi:gas vesicle protein GvpK/gas vesicle protein GvpA/GvpJ/GvpM family